MIKQNRFWLLLAIVLLLGACRPVVTPTKVLEDLAATSTPTLEPVVSSPLHSPLPSNLASPLGEPPAEPYPAPNPAEPYPAPNPAELEPSTGLVRDPDLVILHTNDTWGWYDPCG